MDVAPWSEMIMGSEWSTNPMMGKAKMETVALPPKRPFWRLVVLYTLVRLGRCFFLNLTERKIKKEVKMSQKMLEELKSLEFH